MTSNPRKFRGRILSPIPYDQGVKTQVAPVGSYDIAETGEHFHFFSEDGDPFQMPREHALMHRKLGHLHIEDWES